MSSFKLIYTRSAATEVKEAAEWYNETKRIGETIQGRCINSIDKIEKNPFFASVNYANIRTAACATFPYSIHYSIDKLNKIINIISVYHFSRKPRPSE